MVSTHPTGNALGGRPARQNWGKFDAHNWGGFNARSQALATQPIGTAGHLGATRNVGAMPTYGAHRGTHLLLSRVHGGWRCRRLPSWKCCRVRVGFTGEPDRLSRALFSIFVDRVGMCRLGYQTEISRPGTVLIFTPQIAEGEVQAE